MLRRHTTGFTVGLAIADGAMAVALLAAVSWLRFGPEWLTHWTPVLAQPGAFALAYAVVWASILTLHGLYNPRIRWSLRTESVAIARAAGVLAIVTLSVLFVFRLPDVSRSFLLLLFPAQWLTTLASRFVVRRAFERLRLRGVNLRYVLIVGAGSRGRAFAAKLEAHRELGLRVRGFVDDREADAPHEWPYLGRLDAIERFLHDDVIDEVAICLPLEEWAEANAIISLCIEEGKIVRMPIEMGEYAFASGRIEDLDGTAVFSLVTGPDRVFALGLKRLIDVVAGSVALVLASPIMLFVAIAILLAEGRPLLFRQERVGLHGRRFEMLKFRTMVSNAEELYQGLVIHSDARAFKLTHDPRITRIGSFLRRYSFDELPQLWNVIHGEMSLVGPRPAPPREVEGYDLWHRRRLSMKPGVTGLWQVSARRSDDFENRAQLDLSYIDRWSVWLDVKILARTLPAALHGR